MPALPQAQHRSVMPAADPPVPPLRYKSSQREEKTESWSFLRPLGAGISWSAFVGSGSSAWLLGSTIAGSRRRCGCGLLAGVLHSSGRAFLGGSRWFGVGCISQAGFAVEPHLHTTNQSAYRNESSQNENGAAPRPHSPRRPRSANCARLFGAPSIVAIINAQLAELDRPPRRLTRA